ncbi:glycosyltransferase family 2 protein [Methyloprofundus sp.]|uniref:glycosyltransferase family 2 protein n=1 Tax=Methyloprofundus sp. TaxID=2020875 RepID=UPI003D09E50E
MKTVNALLSIVIPSHNEAVGIQHSIKEIENVAKKCSIAYEIIVVDDGSNDGTYEKVIELVKQGKHTLKAIKLSRNFGKEAAILAGLTNAKGDCVITIDADLQHPPEIIPEMIAAWKDGAHIVSAVKDNRSKDSFIVRLRAKLFNALLSSLGGIDIRHSSDFKLLDREVVNVICYQFPEKIRFYRGLTDWVGFNHQVIPFTVASRNAGEGKWTLGSLIELAATAIISFTSAPLRIITILGSITLVFGFIVAADALWNWFNDEAVSGFTTTIGTLLILGSFIMISLGIIGEYIAKIYDEIKARPAYLIEDKQGFSQEPAESTPFENS